MSLSAVARVEQGDSTIPRHRHMKQIQGAAESRSGMVQGKTLFNFRLKPWTNPCRVPRLSRAVGLRVNRILSRHGDEHQPYIRGFDGLTIEIM